MSWSPDNRVWEILIEEMTNLTCLKLEASMNVRICYTVLSNATLPGSRKLIVKHFHRAADNITRSLITKFLKRHASLWKHPF